MLAKQNKEHFTYADYCTWEDDGQRYELIDGEIHLMASPSTAHQRISGRIFRKFGNYLDGKKCEVFHAAFDVRLNWDKGDNTVVQPDLLVVCDPSKIDDKGCKGAPDIIIEILSPSTAGYDVMTKFAKYHEAGVKELWFVDPVSQTILVHKWDNGNHSYKLYGPTDKITVGILPELTIDMRDIFDIEASQ